MKYFDIEGNQIHAGDYVRFVGEDRLYKIVNLTPGADEKHQLLGYSASNPDYLKRHPDAEEEFYPLSGSISIGDEKCTVDNVILKIEGGEERLPELLPYVVQVKETVVRRGIFWAHSYSDAADFSAEIPDHLIKKMDVFSSESTNSMLGEATKEEQRELKELNPYEEV